MAGGPQTPGLAYLFKLRQTQRVGQMLRKLARRLIVLRRKLERPPRTEPDPAQPALPGLMLEHKGGEWYEHALLLTNWAERVLLAVAQMYRDRAGAENLFDEL